MRARTQRWLTRVVAAVLMMCSLAAVAGAATPYYVDDANGDDGNNGLNWVSAKKTIQAAVGLTADGDTVWVTNGTYNITAQISVTNGITVRSVNGPEVTTVQRSSGNTRVFSINHANAVLDGFTVTNGNLDDHGAGIHLNAGTVSSCRITGNAIPDYKGRHGAGMYVGAAGIVSNSVIVGNTAGRQNSGGGIFLEGGIVRNSLIATNTTGVSNGTRGGGIYSTSADSLVENSIIRGNTCGQQDGGGFYGRGTLRNCLIVDNIAARDGGGVFAALGTLVIENCTIADNFAQVVGGGVHRANNVTLTIRNSIVYGNNSGGDSNPNYGDGTFSYSCAIPLPAGVNNTAADPLFVDPEAGDYRLRPGSSAINNAETLAWMSDAVDLEGNNRILGAGPDIGAYEFVAGGALQIGFIADTPKGSAPLTATFTAYVSGDDLSGLSYAWDFENTGDDDIAGADKDVVAHDYPAGRYSVRLTVTTDDESAELVRTGYIIASPAQLYVATDGLNQAPYTNWTDAATTVQAALELAGHGSRITVSNGIYNVATRNLLVNEAITLESANGSDYTTLRRSSGTIRVIYLDHPDAVLDGFTIRDGANVHGAGVYLNDGTVQNCVIRNNTIGSYVYPWGGGMAVGPGGVVSNCLITANSVGADSRGAGIWLFGGTVIDSTIVSNSTGSAGTIHGGGIFSSSSASLTLNSFILDNACGRYDGGGYYGSGTLRNCLIAGNTAARNGGGVFASGTLIIENCTISGNHAVGTGGGTQGGTIRNSIVYFNTSGGDANQNYSGGTFTYSCSIPLPGGTGNIEDDPELGHDYRLIIGSPCIDEAEPLDWMIGATDLDGNDRILGAAPDIGAFEYAPGALEVNFVADVLKGPAPLTVEFSASVSGADLTGLIYHWDFNNDGTYNLEGADLQTVAYDYPAGVYSVRLVVTTEEEDASVEKPDYIISSPALMYVATNGIASIPYTNWTDAATSLRDAMLIASAGTTIFVSNGIHTVTDTQLLVDEAVTVRSIAGAAATVIQRTGIAGRVLYMDHPESVLDGFTIKGGNMAGPGVGVYLAQGTVMNCTITENTIPAWSGQRGAGMYVGAGGLVSNSWIVANHASHDSSGAGLWVDGGMVTHSVIASNLTSATHGNADGGGVYSANANSIIQFSRIIGNNNGRRDGGGFWGAGLLRNCLIADNTAQRNGGGVLASGTLIIENCTITGNHADGTGGGTQGGTINNSIVYGNTAPANPATDNYSGGTFTYSLSTPRPAGEGNIEDDPIFESPTTGDYRLQVKPVISPAIDAGTPPPSLGAPYADDLAWINTAVDLAGEPRYSNDAVDMGAFEMLVPPAGSLFLLR